MKKFRKSFLVFFLAVLCALCLAFGLTACGGDDDVVDETPPQTEGEGGESTPSTGDGGNTPATTFTASDALKLAAENLGTEYTIKVSNVSLSIPSTYTTSYSTSADGATEDNPVMFTPANPSITLVYAETITFNAGEMYISVSEVNNEIVLKAYASGTISYYEEKYDETETYSATAYGDGETFYLVYTEVTDGETNWNYTLTIDYDYIFGYLLDVDKYDSDDAATYVSAIYSKIASYVSGEDDETISEIIDIFTDCYEALEQTAASQIDNYFTLATTTSGYTLTFDMSVLSDALEDLYTLKYSELIDQVYGDGIYESLTSYITSAGDKTVGEVITDVFATTAAFGLDKDTTFSLIKTLVYEITGETVDLSEILYGNGTIESQYEILREISEMKVDAFLDEYMETSISEISESLTEMSTQTGFQLIFSGYADKAYSIAKTVIDEVCDSFSITISIATDGTASANIKLTDASYTSNGVTYSANGEITITSGASIPATAASASVNNEVYTGFATALKDVLDTNGKYTLADGTVFAVSGTNATVTIGSKAYNITSTSGLSILNVEYNESYGRYYVYIINTTDSGMYDLSFYLYSTTDSKGNTEYYITNYYLYEYDANGNMTKDIWLSGSTTYVYTYTYDNNGNKTASEYKRLNDGEVTYSYTYTYTYDNDGNVLTTKYLSSSGDEWNRTYTYNSDGELLEEVEVDGSIIETTTYKYDENGDQYYYSYICKYDGVVIRSYTSENYNDGGSTTTEYYAEDDWTESYTWKYNADGKQIYYSAVSTYLGETDYSCTEEFEYDENGNRIKETYTRYMDGETYSGSYEYNYTYTYDNNGNLIKQVKVDGYNTYTYEWTYDSKGNLTYKSYERKYNNEVEYSWAYTYNSNGYTTKYVEFDGSTTTTTEKTYNDDGYQLSIKATMTYSDGSSEWESTTYTRNSANAIIKKVIETSEGTSQVFTYNDDGYTLTNDYSDGNGNGYSYKYTYNDNNKVSVMVYSKTSNGTTSTITYKYTYNGITLSSYTADYVCGDDTASYEITYDKYGNKISEKYSDNAGYYYTYTWTYDSDRNKTSEKYEGKNTSYSYTQTFDENGNKTSLSYVSGSYTYKYTWTYDDYNMTSEKYESNAEADYNHVWVYNDYGNVTSEVYTAEEGSYTITYTYNEYGWITEEKCVASTESESYTYTYDYEILDNYDDWQFYVIITVTDENGYTISSYTDWMFNYYDY